MSIFKVEVVKINSINPHPNADRLDIASIEGMAYRSVRMELNSIRFNSSFGVSTLTHLPKSTYELFSQGSHRG
ncbi:hypothetical protein [Nostoc sp.]